MTDFEPDVPEQIEDLLDDLLDVRGNFSGRAVVQHHHIDIAERVQLAAPVAANRDQRQRRTVIIFAAHRRGRRVKNAPQ